MVRKRAADKFLRFADTHAREAAEIGPLVREGTEAIARVDEYRSTVFALRRVERRRHECAQPAARHRVLRGDDCVENGEVDFGAEAKGREKHGRGDFARDARLDGSREEEPDARPFAAPRPFDGARDVQGASGLPDGCGILAPVWLAEFDYCLAGAFVRTQRVCGGGKMAASPVDAEEVEAEDIVRQGGKPPVRTDGAADVAHVADNGLPAVQADGTVPGPA